jgi:hypothetical protein
LSGTGSFSNEFPKVRFKSGSETKQRANSGASFPLLDKENCHYRETGSLCRDDLRKAERLAPLFEQTGEFTFHTLVLREL